MDTLLGLALALLDPTEVYEYFMITTIPAGITLLFTPILNDNVPRVVLVGRPTLASTKLAVSCAMLVAQAVNLAILCYSDTVYSLQAIFATVLSFLASLAVVVFLQFSTWYAFPSASFHNLFLATTLLYDLSMMRHSEKSRGGISIFQFATVTLKLLYVFMNCAFRNPVLVPQPGRLGDQEADAPRLPSVWSCLSWPGLVSIAGFHENADLNDLPEPEWKLCSGTIFRQFKVHWDKADKDSSQALAKAITSTLGGLFLGIIPLRLFHVFLTLAQPLLLWHILTTAFQDNLASGTIVANIAAAAILWISIPVLKLVFTTQSDCIVVSTRAILIAAIYDKMMRVSAMDIRNSTVLSQLIDDMGSIELLIDSTQDVASAIIQAWLGLCLLWPFIGNASLLIFAPTTLVALGSFLSGKQKLRRRNLTTERRQSRVALTSSILKQLRSIQMMGLGPALAVYLDNQRKSEVDALLEERGSRMREFSLLAFNHSMTPVLVIAGYLHLTKPSHSFAAAETFTCFMLIRIISTAFNVAVDRLTCGQQGRQILARIQEFLLLDEVTDKRLLAIAEDDDGDELSPMGATPSVELVQVTVVSKTGEVILLNATLRAFRYGMTMVFGPVACGKSTVLRVILGEVAPSNGRIAVSPGSMVYCDQDVWLPYVCIQNCIIGSAIVDVPWYTLLIRACGLEEDFTQLPDGDMTVIDGPGCILSASLKQRISLARALYNNPTTIILDDPLNAVHYNTASQIYERLFGRRGLVFKWECTVIMATNDFGHLRFADALFTVGYDGRVQSQDVTTYTSVANIRAVLQNSNGIFSYAPTTEEPLHPVPQHQLVEPRYEDERIHRRSQDTSLYSYFQQPAGRSPIWSWSVAVAAAAIMEKMPEIFWGFSLSNDVLSPAYVAGYLAFGVANIVCNRIAAHIYFTRISTKSSLALHWRLIKTLMVATPEFVSTADTTSLLKLFNDDLETISRGLPNTWMQCCFVVISITVDTLIISVGVKYTMTFVVALWALMRLIYKKYLPLSQRLRLLEARALAGVTLRCSETAAGIEHIRAFQQQLEFYEDFHGALTLSQKPYYHTFEAKRQLEYTIGLFTATVGLATISLAHLYPQSSSPARLGLALVSIVDLTATLKFIATIWAKLDQCLGAVFRVRKFCNETPVEVDEVEESRPAQWPSRGAFEFFRVIPEDGSVDEASGNVPVVDASLEGVQKIVVSTRTGSGQGSLILAVLRMINYAGAIRLDDMNVKNVPRVILRSSITTITREGLELEGTLRANLDPFSMMKPFFSDADLISMLHRVKLWDAVQRRGGLDARMKSMRFSKAQKQLLSLARGALHRRRENTKVVLIDDTITHLDDATGKKIHDFIDGEFAVCTVLMVTHDLGAIRTADTVLTVENGAITGVLERYD